MTWGAPFAIIFAASARTVVILYQTSYPNYGDRCSLCIMNYSDEPVAVSPDVKHHVSVDVVCVAEHEPNIRKIVPSNTFDYSDPCFDLVRRIWIGLHGFTQMLARHNMHCPIVLHNM